MVFNILHLRSPDSLFSFSLHELLLIEKMCLLHAPLTFEPNIIKSVYLYNLFIPAYLASEVFLLVFFVLFCFVVFIPVDTLTYWSSLMCVREQLKLQNHISVTCLLSVDLEVIE